MTTGTMKLAPWQLLVAATSIEAAPARSTGVVELAGIVTGRSGDGTLRVTTGFESVVLHPAWPLSGVMLPPAFKVTAARDTGKLFGFVTLKTTSAEPPGSRTEVGVPTVAAIVTDFMDPTLADPEPLPVALK
jgi:hypothetical protein